MDNHCNFYDENVFCIFAYILVEDDSDGGMKSFSDSIKILVPEGTVVGVDPENTHAVTWKFKVCDFFPINLTLSIYFTFTFHHKVKY